MNTTDSRPDHDNNPLLGLGSSDGLGPLPEPDVFGYGSLDIREDVIAYSDDAMRAYASQQVAAERERCARMCESNDANDDYDPGSFYAYLIRGET